MAYLFSHSKCNVRSPALGVTFGWFAYSCVIPTRKCISSKLISYTLNVSMHILEDLHHVLQFDRSPYVSMLIRCYCITSLNRQGASTIWVSEVHRRLTRIPYSTAFVHFLFQTAASLPLCIIWVKLNPSTSLNELPVTPFLQRIFCLFKVILAPVHLLFPWE